MAETAVSFVVQKLGVLLIEKTSSLYGVRVQVEWVERELRGILCFLKDADSKRKGNDERVKNWVRDIRDVAYQAEDVIDTFVIKIESRKQRRDFIGHAKRYALIFDELIARYKVGKEIEGIKSRIREITDSRTTYGIANIGESGGGASSSGDNSLQARRRLYPHFHDDEDVVGFDVDKKLILEKLLNLENKRRSVISIVGMGGLGKTTLAKKVYNSSDIKSYFDIYAWISVSQDYTIIELLKSIIKQVMGDTKDELEKMDELELKAKLYNFLKEKKYLVVMDDIWGQEVWNQIKEVFPEVMNGSKVMFTTRFINVAVSADPGTSPHQLSLLNDEDSWILFLKKVFAVTNIQDAKLSCPDGLIDLGMQLTKRCGGLPLALVVLGGLLSTKEKTSSVWLRALESMTWESTEDGKQCLGILGLSYNDLPYYLKACYLFLGSYPEDYEIDVDKLIWLWVAEGFIPQKRKEIMEETARDYLEELIQRCLVQVVDRRSNGTVERCRIHDLLRDLCISEARNDRFMNVYSNADCTTPNEAYRHVAIHSSISNCPLLPPGSSSPNLHTLLCFDPIKSQDEMNLIFRRSFKLLRVIDLKGTNYTARGILICNLPKEIGSMIYLKYLGLKGGDWTLPSSIGNLPSLQTLDARYSDIVGAFPNSFWKIETLRHVDISMYSRNNDKSSIPRFGGGTKKHMQTLIGVGAGEWMESDLAKMTNLRKLGIRDLTTSHDGRALSDTLGKLVHLCELRLIGESIPTEVLSAFSNHHRLSELDLVGPLSKKQQLPNIDELPPYLTVLVLCDSGLEQDPMPTLEKLPNLRYLSLWSSALMRSAYEGKEMMCSTGGFPCLQHLNLLNLPKLEDWRVQGGAMPSLTHLTINTCEKLKMLPEGLRHVTTLQQLKLYGMPREFVDKVRKDEGQDWHKIQHIPSIVILNTSD